MDNGLNPLYKLIGTKVSTPKGKGKLLHVFDTRVMVDLGRARKVKGKDVRVVDFFKPNEVSECG